jgi:hypothetical protein
MAAARVLESAPLHEPPHSDPATSAEGQSATGMPVRKRALRAVCARARGIFATRCHAARPAPDTTVTRLERCAARTPPCCSRRWPPFSRVFLLRAAVTAARPGPSSGIFCGEQPTGVAREPRLRSTSRSLAWDLCSVGRFGLCVPRSSQCHAGAWHGWCKPTAAGNDTQPT